MKQIDRLRNMNAEEFVDWLQEDWEQLKFSWTQTRTGMIEWLESEVTE